MNIEKNRVNPLQLVDEAKSNMELQKAMLTTIAGMLETSNCKNVDKIMEGVVMYGEAVRLEMMDRPQPEIFGEALPLSEQEFIKQVYGK